LVGKDRLGESDCLSVRSEFTATDVSIKELPQGATADQGILEATFEGCVPISGTSIRKTEEMTAKMRLNVNSSTVDLIAGKKLTETWKQLRK
jgi:hypothetical protein